SRTSNPNAGEFQGLRVTHDSPRIDAQDTADRPLYEHVALAANRWHAEGPGACGLVVGATAPQELERIRALSPDLAFLIPGVGAQGGDLTSAIKFGATRTGVGPVINASRAILYASRSASFADDARKAALKIVEEMRREWR
ncbi:MAG TPA: orotidine 5'-phosphate decarboxylase, partial [Anaerolineae bacterium]